MQLKPITVMPREGGCNWSLELNKHSKGSQSCSARQHTIHNGVTRSQALTKRISDALIVKPQSEVQSPKVKGDLGQSLGSSLLNASYKVGTNAMVPKKAGSLHIQTKRWALDELPEVMLLIGPSRDPKSGSAFHVFPE